MSIWAQIGDDQVTSIPPGILPGVPGQSPPTLDVYAKFMFCEDPLPTGTYVNFIVGKNTGSRTAIEKATTVQDITNFIVPIEGVEFFDGPWPVDNLFVRQGEFLVQTPVAKASLKPVPASLAGTTITVVAYCSYDALGTIKDRFAADSVDIAISGGTGMFLDALERYDPLMNVWEVKAPMPTGRTGPFCGTIGGKIYAVGGYNGSFLSTCEEYDTLTDTWTVKKPMTVERGFGCTAVVGSTLYCIGGYNYGSGRASTVVEKYTPGTDTWASFASLPFPLAFATVQVVGPEIYLFYGTSSFDENENPTGGNGCILRCDVSAITPAWVPVPALYTGAPETTLSANVAIGAFVLPVTSTAGFSSGAVMVGSDTLLYSSAQNGTIVLLSKTTNSYLSGTATAVRHVSLPRKKFAPNSWYDGVSTIGIFNGYDPDAKKPSPSVESYNISTNVSTILSTSPILPRFSAGQAEIAGSLWIVCGSGEKADYLDQVEKVVVSTGTFTGGYAKAITCRTNIGMCADSSYAYAIGGQGNNHANGWLRIDVNVNPDQVRANGKETASVTVTATLPDGDSVPDISPSTGNPIQVKVRGLLFVSKPNDIATTTAPTDASSKPPAAAISILPVLFSSNEIGLMGGQAATMILPRSEDPINEVQNLANYAKANETVLDQNDLKNPPSVLSGLSFQAGESRSLYDIAIEITVDDPFYFGTTDDNATVSGTPTKNLSSGNFSFSPQGSDQGKSGKVSFYSDIASIPDVQIETSEPVNASAATAALNSIQEEIPFGASPLYDAMLLGASARNGTTTSNMMSAASDNENNGSASTAQKVADSLNDVSGVYQFPAFVTTFVVTEPVSLAARKERTDVADLELISSSTGGNSFTIERHDYINWVVNKIKTSAPSSIGSGSITMTHDIDGSLYGFSFTVGEMLPGNTAIMTIETSIDGYNWDDLGIALQADTGTYPGDIISTYVLPTPTVIKKLRYKITLASETFQTPILKSVELTYIKPNEQYLFTYPQTVGGQVSELAAVTNERLPSGGKAAVGVSHGASLEFDRDYATSGQRSVSERGTIRVIDRSIAPVIGDNVFRETLTTENQLVYVAPSGTWAQDAILTVFLNDKEVLSENYVAYPEEGKIAFAKRLAYDDSVAIEVQNPATFRVGVKVTNPALLYGVLDSFAFMWGETEREGVLKPNLPPKALNLFISPSPVMPGGPLTANYTFYDPDGDDEDLSKTQITWFRNSAPVPELANKKTVSNTDIVARRSDGGGAFGIAKGQQWFFTVRPSDGKSFGSLATSATITVANQLPVATNAYLVSSNQNDPNLFTSSDAITAKFTYADPDGDSQQGTIYTFFVNGVEAKTGTQNSVGGDETDSAGNKILGAGKTVFATVVPFDGTAYGIPVTTGTITITPTPPTVSNVSILPIAPSPASRLTLSYTYNSVDGSADQSTIAWFKNGIRQSSLDNFKIVGAIGQGQASVLYPGDIWYAIVTPFDGSATGNAAQSNSVRIQF